MSFSRARKAVLRSFLLFTPFLLIALAGLVALSLQAANDGARGGLIVAIVLVSLVSLLLGYQVVQSLRDLFAEPVETTGQVDRRWTRNEVFIFRNDYVFVGGNVFRLDPEQFIEVNLGDIVRVEHYPHTSTVQAIEVVQRAGQGGGDDG